MANPFCKQLRELISKELEEMGIECHKKGTMVTIEGPRFSSKAESNMHRMMGGDVVNIHIK